MADHRANVEDMDGVNTNKLFEAMKVEFDDIMEIPRIVQQSNSTECLIGLSGGNKDHAEKFVQSSEIRALNRRTKHCIISCYYTTDGDTISSALCLACMIDLSNIGIEGMYLVRKHKDCSFYTLDSRWSCSECREPMYIIFPCSMCPLCACQKLLSA